MPLYRDLLEEAAERAGSEIWAYCLMPNHVHLIVLPTDEDRLRRTFADAHRRYTGFINARHRWTGHLWQGRFGAVVMDEAHLAHAMRYVSLTPVRAGLTARTEDWRWPSVRVHLAGEDDDLVHVAPALTTAIPQPRLPMRSKLIERCIIILLNGAQLCGISRLSGDSPGEICCCRDVKPLGLPREFGRPARQARRQFWGK